MRFLKKCQHNSMLFRKLAVLLLFVTVLCGCDTQAQGPTQSVAPQLAPQIKITTADTTVTGQNAVLVDLKEVDSVCSITEPGCYLLSGTLSGKIEVDAQDQIVHLILGGVDVKSVSGPALQITSAGKVIVTLQEGTKNTLRDSATYPQGSLADACIYSECDLTINGAGSLDVSGYYEDAIHTKDVLKILGGDVFVQAKQDGIQGNDGIVVTCQSLTVQSERNGLYTTKTGKPAKGNIEIYSGEHSIIAGGYAISCTADLYVDRCSLYAMGVLDTYKVDGESFVAEAPNA